jgi:photosynthetic reaction center H subunit
LLEGGKSVTVPDLTRKEPAYNGVATSPTSGAPIEPTGEGMLAAVGPGAYSNREDVPEMTWHGKPLIPPLRVVIDYKVA